MSEKSKDFSLSHFWWVRTVLPIVVGIALLLSLIFVPLLPSGTTDITVFVIALIFILYGAVNIRH